MVVHLRSRIHADPCSRLAHVNLLPPSRPLFSAPCILHNPSLPRKQYSFPNNDRILSNSTQFDGNATEYGMSPDATLAYSTPNSRVTSPSDWVVDKGSIFNTNQTGGELAMILTEDNGGTRISSTRYLHYGTVTANCE